MNAMGGGGRAGMGDGGRSGYGPGRQGIEMVNGGK